MSSGLDSKPRSSSELLLFVFARLREEEEEEDVRGWYGVTGSEVVADGEDNEEEANMDGGIKGGLGVLLISAMVTRRSAEEEEEEVGKG